MGYANTISSQLAYIIQNFPAVLAAAPASIQAGIQGLLAYNPLPYVQQIVTNQLIYAELAYSSLQSAGGYFTAGLQALPPHLESAFQFTLMGNYTAAQGQLFQGVLGLLIAPPGIEVTGETGSLNVTYHHYSLFPLFGGDLPTSVTGSVDAGIVPVGTVGSLLPIFGFREWRLRICRPAAGRFHRATHRAELHQCGQNGFGHLYLAGRST